MKDPQYGTGTYIVPRAREAVMDVELVRPDWTIGGPRDPRLLWLDKNENADPRMAQVAGRVIAEIDPVALSTYPDCAPLYHALAKHLELDPHKLMLAAGSDGVIRSVFEAFINPGDVVVHTRPTFAMYPVYSRMYGASVEHLDYEAGDGGPVLNPEAVIAAITEKRPKLVCLPNPDSPTGTIFAPEDLRHIIATAGRTGALVLIDEAYHPFHDFTVVPLIDEFPHLVVARTFAKAWGLAGLRIGYAVASPQVTTLLHKVRPMYEVNTFAVAAMERMLPYQNEMLASVRRLNAGRDAFLGAMKNLNLQTIQAHGNFLHVAFGACAPQVHDALEDLVLYRKDFSERCLKGYSRFSATTVELFKPVIERISNVVVRHN